MTTGVLVMAYGTPATPHDVEAYYTHIRRGRPPTAEQLADLVRRYDAIGGTSPLAERTEAQRAGIAAALGAAHPGGWNVVLGQKHAAPFIEDGVATLADTGVDAIVGLVLAPHFSAASVGQYLERAGTAAAARGVAFAGIRSWHHLGPWLDLLAESVQMRLTTLPPGTEVVFTAHSLPERALVDDPYPEQLAQSAAAIASRAGLTEGSWSLGWQSAGRTPEPWRGPDILEVLRRVAGGGTAASGPATQAAGSGGPTSGQPEPGDTSAGGDASDRPMTHRPSTGPPTPGVLVCPQGFVSDHLEVVYDLDIEAASLAKGLGLAFARTDVMNDHAPSLAALADLVAEHAASLR